jgi:hypothetical protein
VEQCGNPLRSTLLPGLAADEFRYWFNLLTIRFLVGQALLPVRVNPAENFTGQARVSVPQTKLTHYLNLSALGNGSQRLL